MWLAPAVLTGHLWFILVFCLAFWLYYERIMFAEEQFLQRKFGKPYQDWGSQRPAFIPKKLMWQRPNLQFSWKKSVKKEKNGLAALLLVLAGILYVEQVGIRRQLFWPELDFWTLSALASTLLYLVLKFIKKYTHWLDEEGR
jgi:protein-S-isoprenylcysteine O-methyltransferase Ste14